MRVFQDQLEQTQTSICAKSDGQSLPYLINIFPWFIHCIPYHKHLLLFQKLKDEGQTQTLLCNLQVWIRKYALSIPS